MADDDDRDGPRSADDDAPAPERRGVRTRPMGVNSPLKAAVIVVVVLAGVLVLAKGFPSASGTPSTNPTPTATGTPKPTTSTTSPTQGVTVAIYNSTTTAGLAAGERQRLETAGYTVTTIGDTSPAFATTTIYYEAGSQSSAEYMKTTFYPNAVVKPAPDAYKKAKLSLILGSDFTQAP